MRESYHVIICHVKVFLDKASIEWVKRDMPRIQAAHGREPKCVMVLHSNPAIPGRTGHLHTGSITLRVDGIDVALHSVLAVAKRLRITSMRVLQLIQTGRLKAHRFSRDWFVLEKELQDYLKSRPRRGRPPKVVS